MKRGAIMLAIVLTASIANAAPKPLGQSLTGQAKVDYDAGRMLYGDNDYKGAALKFRSAYDASKDARLLWNIAVCEKAQRHYAKVQELVLRYVAEGQTVISTAERHDADDLLKTVEPLVVSLTVTSDPPGAKVVIDGEEVGTTPLAGPLRVDVGAHKVVVEKSGYRSFERTTTLTAATATIEARLVAPSGTLEVTAPVDAAVAVDGTAVGRGTVRIPLPVGVHGLRVTESGMVPFVSDVAIEDDRVRRLSVTLERDRSGLPVWFWVGAGVLAAGALAVSGYFLFHGSETAAAPERGTLDPGFVYSVYR
ncbi:MAG: PEGA domain-containing protein [Polyangiaceae bacterium]